MVSYKIRLDETWTTRSARITGQSASGTRHARLETDGLPVHRLGLDVGARAPAAAAYVRALDFRIGRLDQDYLRCTDEDRHQRYDYAAPVFDFACRLVYDESGLVLDYPGIAVRAF
jgi:uncharacterized protein